MRTYFTAIENTYYATNAPLTVVTGYYNTKMSGYECITKLNNNDYEVVPYVLTAQQESAFININTNTVMTKNENSYTLFVIDFSQTDNPPIPYSFYTYNNVTFLSSDGVADILLQEYPAIYKDFNILNQINNAGNVSVLYQLYRVLYSIFYNSITSVGANGTYNNKWEYVYLGVNNLLNNAKYPVNFLKTLMNINTQCSTQGFSIAITISRLTFQFIGIKVPVQVVYDDMLGGYYINIYYNVPDVWSLGTPGFTELDDTTYLLGAGTGYLWVINLLVARLMPAFVKWQIQYLSLDTFETNFDVADVDIDDYYNPAILYDAYMVVNNNNNFNTKGYNLNG